MQTIILLFHQAINTLIAKEVLDLALEAKIEKRQNKLVKVS